MTRSEFVELVGYMIDTFGVRSYRDNIEDPIEDEDEDLWFECPECGEPILYEDYGEDRLLTSGYCPVCCGRILGDSIEGQYKDDFEEEEEE